MLVFRFEDRQGLGAFSAGFAREHDAACPRTVRSRAYEMPDPSQEPRETSLHLHYRTGSFTKDQVFGFNSLSQARKAFRSKIGRRMMDKAGCVLSAYEVPDWAVLKGTAQVVFNRTHARLVQRLDCATAGGFFK